MGATWRQPDPQSDGDPRPWERPGAVRRDGRPPRGEQLRWLANASLLCGALAFLVAPALIGLPLGVAVGVLAERDLTRVDRGAAPADGRDDLQLALGRAALGAGLSALGLGFCGALLLGFVTSGHL